MNATQDPSHNAIPPSRPKRSPSAAAEIQRRYRLKQKRELEALHEIRAIIARLDGETS